MDWGYVNNISDTAAYSITKTTYQLFYSQDLDDNVYSLNANLYLHFSQFLFAHQPTFVLYSTQKKLGAIGHRV